MTSSGLGLGKTFLLFFLGFLGSFLMLVVRSVVTGRMIHLFLFWNLILAVIPLVVAVLTAVVTHKGPRLLTLPALVVFSFAWLIFFPNSSYLFTDFIHLIQKGLPAENPNARGMANMLLWYDVIVRSLFSFAGHFLGLVSLWIMHRQWKKAVGRVGGWVLVSVSTLLAGYGVFMGRFLRLNSWNLFTPGDAWTRLVDNLSTPDAWLFSISLAVFLLISYFFVYLFKQARGGE